MCVAAVLLDSTMMQDCAAASFVALWWHSLLAHLVRQPRHILHSDAPLPQNFQRQSNSISTRATASQLAQQRCQPTHAALLLLLSTCSIGWHIGMWLIEQWIGMSCCWRCISAQLPCAICHMAGCCRRVKCRPAASMLRCNLVLR